MPLSRRGVRLAALAAFATLLIGAVTPLADLLGARTLHAHVPGALRAPLLAGVAPWQWLALVLAALLGWLVGTALAGALAPLLRELVGRVAHGAPEAAHATLRRPIRALAALIVFAELAPAVHLSRHAGALLAQVHRSLVVAVLAWLVARVVAAVAVSFDRAATADTGPPDRAMRTRVRVVRRLAEALILVTGSALVLLQFDAVKSVGISLLASAGLAGLVLGFAAQRSLGTLLAGIQVAVAQPVRIGDQVVLDGEFGTVEDITLTFALVRVWDDRRLVVPVSRFLDTTFQNWTRVGSALVGVVLLRCDYRVPVARIREALEAFVATRSEWNHKTAGLQMTDADETAVTLRAVVSADDASRLFDLRCAVREHLVSVLTTLDDGAYLPYPRRVDVPHKSGTP